MAVFDANVVVALIVDLPWSPAARGSVSDHEERHAPSLLAVECANALWRNIEAGVIAPDDARTGLHHALSLMALAPVERLSGDALELAVTLKHSVYDCCYLALAARDNDGLITADRRLAESARKAGINCSLLV